MNRNRKIKKYSKDELIQAIADTSSVNVNVVKLTMQAFEDVITRGLKSTSSEEDVSIKLFEGFYVDSSYVPGKKQTNNLTGKVINVADKIKIKPRITRRYLEKINQ